MRERTRREAVSAWVTSGRRWLVVLAAALIGVGGVVGASIAGVAVARADARTARRAFERSSAEVASTLQLSVRGEESLLISVSAFVLDNPDASFERFTQWLGAVHAFERYPELESLGNVIVVPAAELPGLSAAMAGNPNATIGSDGLLRITPPGDRPYYCLGIMGADRVTANLHDGGFDYCAGSNGLVLTGARDAGLGSYEPSPSAEGVAKLGVETPIYRGGVVPATVSERRAAFVGWIGMTLNQTALLQRALQGHPDMAVSMRYRLNSSDAEFVSGPIPIGAQTTAIDLQNGWTVHTFSVIDVGGMFSNGTALVLFLTVSALSVVLASLVLLLGTGRARALRLVTERTGELRHLALHDALTDLPNRALIIDRIEQLLARNRRQGTSGAALFVDLDDFKNVNDTLGHAGGDRLLKAVAERLTATLRDADTIGRMGGDEFIVLIDGGPSKAAPALVAQRFLDVMRQPFELESAPMPIAVDASIGIAIGDRATGGELLRDADVALYEAKAAGKNRYAIFDMQMNTVLGRRLELEFDLHAAIDGDQFRLVYQPIYRLDDLSLVAVEALLRWDHPTLGVVLPDEFIPILEQSGQIDKVGRWVLHQACNQMAAWHRKGDTLDVSVNISGRQLDHDGITDNIRSALDASALDPGFLIVEVNETALMRNAVDTAERLRAIRALGVRIAVDDFGTGYSSLAYLRQFPVDCIKIDRSLTNAINTSQESRALVRTLVQLGKDLGLTTLAEGVETATEMDDLRRQLVNQAQGFLFSKPLDPNALETQVLQPTRPTPATIDS